MPNKDKICIALDAMGGDNAPTEIIKGAVTALKEYPNVKVILVGFEDKIRQELGKFDYHGLDIDVLNATEVIEMGESPTESVKKKKDSSIVKSVGLVASGEADAFISAGNTGACMTASFFGLGRIKGIKRPAIAALLPTVERRPTVLIDAGANSDCEAPMLVQFAHMGSIFAEKILEIQNPRVGILNIGGEAKKGNALALNTYQILKENNQGLNFVGNVEGREVFLGACDVIVCDGFTGNVTLKVAEGVAKMLIGLLTTELQQDARNMIGAMLAKPAFKRLKKRIDYEEYGGSLLLGVNGICVIAHGGSNEFAIKNAIRVGKESIERDVTSKIMAIKDLSK